MKTTVNISDALLAEVRKIAAQENTSVKAMIEEGLRRVVSERKKTEPFRLRKATFKGEGIHQEMVGVSWEKIRDAAYKGRGG